MKLRLARGSVMASLAIALTLGCTMSQAQKAPFPKTTVIIKNEAVSGVPDREAFLIETKWAPGTSTGLHIHDGDEYGFVLDGELTITFPGSSREPLVVKAGEAYHNVPGILHVASNASKDTPARSVGTLIIQKGKPFYDPR